MSNAGHRAERELVGQARLGDADALRRLVELHKDRLFAFISRMVRHRQDAEDICQEAFLKAFRSLDSFSTKYRFSTWLFTIGYRVCLNQLRKKRPTGDLNLSSLTAAQDDSPFAVLESEEAGRLKKGVWTCVDRLSPPQRAVVLLFYRNDMGCDQIACILELPVATVKSHLHRARARLRDMLESVADRDLELYRNRSAAGG